MQLLRHPMQRIIPGIPIDIEGTILSFLPLYTPTLLKTAHRKASRDELLEMARLGMVLDDTMMQWAYGRGLVNDERLMCFRMYHRMDIAAVIERAPKASRRVSTEAICWAASGGVDIRTVFRCYAENVPWHLGYGYEAFCRRISNIYVQQGNYEAVYSGIADGGSFAHLHWLMDGEAELLAGEMVTAASKSDDDGIHDVLIRGLTYQLPETAAVFYVKTMLSGNERLARKFLPALFGSRFYAFWMGGAVEAFGDEDTEPESVHIIAMAADTALREAEPEKLVGLRASFHTTDTGAQRAEKLEGTFARTYLEIHRP